VYRSLLAFLGERATVEDLTPAAVRAYRDALEHADRTPATIAKHLSAIRGLAAAVGADADVRTVRSASVARGEPRALSHEEFARLLKMPDRRTRQGKRDLALLHLLGSAGPLDEDALAAIVAWVKSRPTAASEHLLLSLPRSAPPDHSAPAASLASSPVTPRAKGRLQSRNQRRGTPCRWRSRTVPTTAARVGFARAEARMAGIRARGRLRGRLCEQRARSSRRSRSSPGQRGQLWRQPPPTQPGVFVETSVELLRARRPGLPPGRIVYPRAVVERGPVGDAVG
jgi:hypothetical protein